MNMFALKLAGVTLDIPLALLAIPQLVSVHVCLASSGKNVTIVHIDTSSLKEKDAKDAIPVFTIFSMSPMIFTSR